MLKCNSWDLATHNRKKFVIHGRYMNFGKGVRGTRERLSGTG